MNREKEIEEIKNLYQRHLEYGDKLSLTKFYEKVENFINNRKITERKDIIKLLILEFGLTKSKSSGFYYSRIKKTIPPKKYKKDDRVNCTNFDEFIKLPNNNELAFAYIKTIVSQKSLDPESYINLLRKHKFPEELIQKIKEKIPSICFDSNVYYTYKRLKNSHLGAPNFSKLYGVDLKTATSLLVAFNYKKITTECIVDYLTYKKPNSTNKFIEFTGKKDSETIVVTPLNCQQTTNVEQVETKKTASIFLHVGKCKIEVTGNVDKDNLKNIISTLREIYE